MKTILFVIALMLTTTAAIADDCADKAKPVYDGCIQRYGQANAAQCASMRDDSMKSCTNAIAAQAENTRVREAAEAAHAREVERLRVAAAEEAACQASPQCMADRAKALAAQRIASTLEKVCELQQDRALVVSQLNAERSNPAGVVNLVTLHELGRSLQAVDAVLPAWKARYVALAHKTPVCP